MFFLCAYVYPQISNISSAITSLSGTVSNLSGYVYTISVGQWSTFPATQNVNISDYVISNISAVFVSNNLTVSGLTTLSSLTIQNNLSVNQLNGASYPQVLGTAGQVLTISSTGNTLYWASTGGGGDIANWATCNAVQNVNLSGFSISNVLIICKKINKLIKIMQPPLNLQTFPVL